MSVHDRIGLLLMLHFPWDETFVILMDYKPIGEN